MTTEQADLVKERAMQKGIDMAEWLREAVEEKLQREMTDDTLRGIQETPPIKDYDSWFMRRLDDPAVRKKIRQIIAEGL